MLGAEQELCDGCKKEAQNRFYASKVVLNELLCRQDGEGSSFVPCAVCSGEVCWENDREGPISGLAQDTKGAWWRDDGVWQSGTTKVRKNNITASPHYM